MYPWPSILLFVVGMPLNYCMGRDCDDDVKFQAAISMDSWCKTDIDSCSLGTLKSRFSTLFNATGWTPGKPEHLNATSFCQTDGDGLNQAGINITWRPPSHSGAKEITGFELRVEGYDPGYKCSILKLNENITKTMAQSDIIATIYPVERHKNFIISLFSLPRSDDSTQVTYSLHSLKCERKNISWSSYDVKFNILYDNDKKELNVTFTPPPSHFNLTEFTMVILGIQRQYFSRVRINKTFHVFQNIGVGKYKIRLSPYNPRPHDDKLCKCRDDRNKCILCLGMEKHIGKESHESQRLKHHRLQRKPIQNGQQKSSSRIQQEKGKIKTKSGRKRKRNKPNTLFGFFFQPAWRLFVFYVFLSHSVSDIGPSWSSCYLLWRRRRSQRIFYHKPKRSGSENITKPGYLICFEENDPNINHSLMSNCLEIFKGVLGNSVNVQKLAYRHTSDFNNQLLRCLKKISKTGSSWRNGSSSTDRECSETCLVDKKVHGKIPVNIDCCLRSAHKEAVVVICIFGHCNTSVDILNACENACDDTSNENIESLSVCVYPNQNDMPVSMSSSKGFAYKDQLPQLLDYLKNALLRQKDLSDSKKSEITFITNGDTDSMKEIGKYERMSASKDTRECWVELPGLQISNGPWIEGANRRRYVSSDSGWGASENSFRSTPIDEGKEISPESSLQFDLESEQECQSPNKESQNSFLPRNLSYVHHKHPALTRLQYTHPLMKCPSEISFFPPDEINDSSDNIAIVSDKVQTTNKQLHEHVDNTSLSQIETVPCKIYTDEHVSDRKRNRKSPSMDTLMDMLKDINDQSTFYMETEAAIGEVHSVFDGTA